MNVIHKQALYDFVMEIAYKLAYWTVKPIKVANTHLQIASQKNKLQ